MKKTLFATMLMCLACSAFADDNITSSMVKPLGTDNWTLQIDLNNSVSNYVAFQMDMTLPVGVTVQSVAAETARLAKGSNVTIGGESVETPFVVDYNTIDATNNVVRILAYNLGNNAISGTTGNPIVTVKLAPGSVAAANMTATFSNILFVKSTDLAAASFANASATSLKLGDANLSNEVNVTDITAVVTDIYGDAPEKYSFLAADVNGSNEINVTDITGIVSIIYGGSNAREMNANAGSTSALSLSTMTIQSGETVQMPVYLTNAENLSSFQFDLTMPEGVNATSAIVNSNAHSIVGGYVEDGAYRVMAYSETNAKFSDSATPVAYITLAVDANLPEGTYDVYANSVVASANGEEQKLDSAIGQIVVDCATGINTISIDSEEFNVFTLDGMKVQCQLKSLPKGVYIVNGKKYVIK